MQEYKGEYVTENIVKCEDGVYRWYYEFPMMRNPTILFTVYKVLGMSFGAVYLLVAIMTIADSYSEPGALLKITGIFLLIMLVFAVIGFLAYVIIAASYGWKYTVLFEMYEDRIIHIQTPRQFKKAEAAAWLTMFAGVVTGNIGRVGQGLLIATKQSSVSVYDRVKTVKVRKGRHTIFLNQTLEKNQIYADEADFEFVKNYILQRCTNAKIK